LSFNCLPIIYNWWCPWE